MRVVAYDPYLAPSRAKAMQSRRGYARPRLLAQSDYITRPHAADGRHQVHDRRGGLREGQEGRPHLQLPPPFVIKESALLAALKAGEVAAAGLDVYGDEPLAADSELRKLPNVVLTPHLGASTAEAQDAVGVEIAEDRRRPEGQDHPQRGQHALDRRRRPGGPRALPGPRQRTPAHPRAADRAPARSPRSGSPIWGKIVDLDVDPRSRAPSSADFLRRISGRRGQLRQRPRSTCSARASTLEVVKSASQRATTPRLIEGRGGGARRRRLSPPWAHADRRSPHNQRIVGINGREVEVAAEGKLLVLENVDQPGMVGAIGTILGRDKVNIADMSLSRHAPGGIATMVVRVDTEPSENARREIKGHPAIKQAKIRAALNYVVAVALGYLLGSCRSGGSSRACRVNIFEVSSRSPGATNVRRVLGARAGNGLRPRRPEGGGGRSGPALVHGGGTSTSISQPPSAACTRRCLVSLIAALVGHSFSCFTRFKGGKGRRDRHGRPARPPPCQHRDRRRGRLGRRLLRHRLRLARLDPRGGDPAVGGVLPRQPLHAGRRRDRHLPLRHRAPPRTSAGC